ncbi:MAG: hypothetical protein GY894_10935 [Planctomycetes bacterium]|nr:hypothetical protein [Planctomycetota bacterium]MCP4839851.1 hypothetical protein [Planctomycetota bacterium]
MSNQEAKESGGLSMRVILQLCGGAVLLIVLVAIGGGVFDQEAPPRVPVAEKLAPPKPISEPVVPKNVPQADPVSPAVDPALAERPVEVLLDPPAYEYGFMRPQDVAVRSIRVTNLDPEPIRLKGTWRGCSCTKLDVRPKILQSGESIDVPATMTAGLTPTTKDSTIKLELVGRPPIVLPVKGEIIRGVRARPRDIDTYRYRGAEGNYIPNGRVVLDAPEGVPFRILSVNGEQMETASKLTHVIPWDVSGYDAVTGLDADGDLIPAYWLVETNHPETPVMEIMVRHRAQRPEPRGERPWFFVEQRVNVGGIPPGGYGEYVLPIKWQGGKPNTADEILGVHSESDQFSAKLVEAKIKGRETLARIRITPAEGVEGPISGDVVIDGRLFTAAVPTIAHAARSTSQ